MDTEQRHELTPYVVVLKADSNARFRRPDESMAFRIPVNDAPGFIKFSTRFTDEGHEAATPRELIVECMGFAPTLDGAIDALGMAASALATHAAFVTNGNRPADAARGG